MTLAAIESSAVIAEAGTSGLWLLAAGAIGAVVAIAGSIIVGQIDRRAAVADTARSEAREAYLAFLVDANYCAHICGNNAPNEHDPDGLDDDARKTAGYYFDHEVMARYRVVEVAGSVAAVRAAHKMRSALRDFRDVMCEPGAELPTYRDDEYDAIYDPFVKARDESVRCVRDELKPLRDG